MTKHSFNAQILLNGTTWTDVTSDIRQNKAVTISKGGGDVTETPRPSTLALTFNDPTGKYRPDRATSPFYGQAGRNTAIAVPGGIFEISEWKPDRSVDYRATPARGEQTTAIDAGGPLRRIGSWTDPIESAVGAAIASNYSNILGWWKLEDRAGSTYPAATVGQLTNPALNFNASFGQTDSPYGGNTTVELSPSSAAAGFMNAGTDTGWTFGFFYKLRANPTVTGGSFDGLFTLRTSDRRYLWTVQIDSAGYNVILTESATGTQLFSTPITWAPSPSPVFWTFLELQVTRSTATTLAWKLAWYNQNDTGVYSFGASGVAASAGIMGQWQIIGNASTDGAQFGQIVGLQGVGSDLLQSSMLTAFNGYPGETAGDRFTRLMNLNGVASTLLGSAAATVPMGPQGSHTLLEHLQIIRDSEDGVLYDDPGSVAVTFRTRYSLYAQSPALALTFGTNVADPFLPVIGDLDTSNVIQVTNEFGSSATARDDTSIMGTAPPPGGVGTYKQQIDVNLGSDLQLAGRATWALAIGTNPEARYNSVVIDLDASPGLEATCNALKPGDRVTVTGADPDVTDLMITNIEDSYDTQFRRVMTLTCRPYRPYGVAKYGVSGTVYLYDSAVTVANVTYASGTTSINFRSSSAAGLWSTTATPYDVMCAGERWTVNTMGAVSGTAPNLLQNASVTRSVNGVVKSIPINSPIRAVQLGRYGF
jgi:hypothetical protein